MVDQLLVHGNQLVDEQLLVQMNPDVCRKEIRVTLLAHSGIQCSLANTHCMFSDAHTVVLCKIDAYCVVAYKAQ